MESLDPSVESELIVEPTEQKTPAAPGLLDQLVGFSVGQSQQDRGKLPIAGDFLAARSFDDQLRVYISNSSGLRSMRDVQNRLAHHIARIDALISAQVNAILHHSEFQQLESSWRGLKLLWDKARTDRELIPNERGTNSEWGDIKLRVLTVTKSELRKDFDKSIEFDQSELFDKVYEAEFGSPGGEPYGLLVSDFEFANNSTDIELLHNISGVAAASFAPFIASASPDLLGLEEFETTRFSLENHFRQKDFIQWNSLRKEPDSQFVGLTVPHIVMREPYEDDGSFRYGFRFRESTGAPDQQTHLMGSAAWGFATVVMRAYASSGWFADIRGVTQGEIAGGIVVDLPTISFGTDKDGICLKSSTNVSLTDYEERTMSQLGLIPLSDCPDTPYSVFYSNCSLHEPATYSDTEATANARISSMFQYVLCASRFAHYLKVILRDKIGSMATPSQLQDFLNNDWINQYTSTRASTHQFPLRAGSTCHVEETARAGVYRVTIHLWPHYQLDQLSGSMRLLTRLNK